MLIIGLYSTNHDKRKSAFKCYIYIYNPCCNYISINRISKFWYSSGPSNSTSSITPEQKAAIRDPNNPKLNFVNTTESKICRIPKTITNTITSANTTTGPEAQSIAPPLPGPES